MLVRKTQNLLIILTLISCVPIATSVCQEPYATDSYQNLDDGDIGEFDPGLIESEMIQGAAIDLQPSGNPPQSNPNYTGNRYGRDGNRAVQLQSPPAVPRQQPSANRAATVINQDSTRLPTAPRQPVRGRNISTNSAPMVTMPMKTEDMLETRSTPAIQTQIIAPRSITISKPARMYIQAQNVGEFDVDEVKVIATLPSHAKFSNSIPRPTSVNGQKFEFTLNSLKAGGKQVVQLDVTPTEKLPLNISTQIQIASQQQVAVSVKQPVLEVQIDGPDSIQMGQTIENTVIVKNVGDGAADNVRITSELPDNIETVAEPQKTLVRRLVPGQTAKFQLSSFARTSGSSQIIYQVSANGAEAQKGRKSIRVIRPELAVQMWGPKQNYLGRDGIYRIELENASEIEINDVVVQLNVSPGLQVNTISQQAKVDKRNGSLNWKFERMEGQQKQIIQFRAKAMKEGSQICDLSVITREAGSKQLALNTAVNGRADLSIRVFDEGEPVGIGTKSEFKIEVTNHGSRDAEQVAVSVDLPGGLMPVNQQGYTVNPSGNYITFDDVNIKAGETQTFSFRVVASAEGEHVVRGTVSQQGSMQTISSENSIFVFEAENTKVSDALTPEFRR